MSDARKTFERAMAEHQSGNLTAACHLYSEVIDEYPDHADALHLCGMAHYQYGNALEAERLIRAAVALRPGQRSYHSNLGLVLSKLGRAEEAMRSFRCALDIDPGFPDALINLGTLHVAQGANEAAESTFRSLLSIDPNHAEACNNLAVLLSARQEFGEAQDLLSRALAARSDYCDARMNLAHLLMQRGCRHAAIAELELACEHRVNDARHLRALAQAFHKYGEEEKALPLCQRAIELDPEHPESHVCLGSIEQSLRRFEAAESCYRRALELDPENAHALNNLGTLFMHRGRAEAALGCFDASLESSPKFADALYNRGTALQALGGLIQAREQFLAAIELKPNFPQAYRCLVDIHRATARHPEAERVLHQWLEQVPDDPAPRHLLGAMNQADAPSRASDDYIRTEFDRFACDFDETLARLGYRAPQHVVDAIRDAMGSNGNELVTLDAGCGTGLCGPLLRPMSKWLVGVDLSDKMIAQAGMRDSYDELAVAELTAFMSAQRSTYDLIVSADTLNYFGDLYLVFEAAARALKPGGWFAFTLEDCRDDAVEAFRLELSGRYSHTRSYAEGCLRDAGFVIRNTASAVLRLELQQPVDGLILVASRPS